MKAVRAWAIISGTLILLALCLKTMPTSAQGLAILAAVLLTNLGLLVFILKR